MSAQWPGRPGLARAHHLIDPKLRPGGKLWPTRICMRHFPDEIGRPNAPSCRSQKVGIIKCKSRADRSKPVGLRSPGTQHSSSRRAEPGTDSLRQGPRAPQPRHERLLPAEEEGLFKGKTVCFIYARCITSMSCMRHVC